MQVKWTRKALLNLDDAVELIAADSPVAASKVALCGERGYGDHFAGDACFNEMAKEALTRDFGAEMTVISLPRS